MLSYFKLLCTILVLTTFSMNVIEGQVTEVPCPFLPVADAHPPCPGATCQECNKVATPNVCSQDSGDILKGSQCLGNDPADINWGICACNKATHVNHCDGGSCVLIANSVGAPCVIPEQCESLGYADDGTRLATCQSNSCVCNGDSVPSADSSKCLPRRTAIGQPCAEDSQCLGLRNNPIDSTPEITMCNPTTGTCDCGSEGVPGLETATAQKCYRIANTIGDTCDYNNQCERRLGDEATVRCEGHFCNCISINAFESGSRCVRKANRNCDRPDQCSHLGTSDCVIPIPPDPVNPAQRKCSCTAGFPWMEETKCLDFVSKVGDACETPQQCQNLGPVGTITDCWLAYPSDPKMYCECIEETATSHPAGDKCLALIRDGVSICEDNVQCPQNSMCTTSPQENLSKCRCSAGYVSSPVGLSPLTCLPVVISEFGACTFNEQCIGGMGELAECRTVPSTGLPGCQCSGTSKFLKSDHTCYTPVAINKTCGADGQCQVVATMHSQCHPISRTCSCKAPSSTITEWQGVCYERKRVGDSCENHNQCTVFLSGNSECDGITKRCTCIKGSYPEFENTNCHTNKISFANNLKPNEFIFLTIFISIAIFIKV